MELWGSGPSGPGRDTQGHRRILTTAEASGPSRVVECGAAAAVRYILVGALALAAGALLGLLYFWRQFGLDWLRDVL